MTTTEHLISQLEGELEQARASEAPNVAELENKLGRLYRAHAMARTLHGAWADGEEYVRVPVVNLTAAFVAYEGGRP